MQGRILLPGYAVLVGMFGNELFILTLFVFVYREVIYSKLSIGFLWPNNSI